MPGTTIPRQEMIRQLVEHSMKEAVAEPQQHWLREVFEKGFAGYGKLSSRQLLEEMHLRGLMPGEDAADEMLEDAGEDESDDVLFEQVSD